MTEVITVLIVFGSIIAVVAIVSYFSYKEEEMKTRLRMKEMEAGLPPGTYSRISKKEMKKAKKFAKEHPDWQEQMERKSEDDERAALMEGIANLKARIDNIDTIMQKKREGNGND